MKRFALIDDHPSFVRDSPVLSTLALSSAFVFLARSRVVSLPPGFTLPSPRRFSKSVCTPTPLSPGVCGPRFSPCFFNLPEIVFFPPPRSALPIGPGRLLPGLSDATSPPRHPPAAVRFNFLGHLRRIYSLYSRRVLSCRRATPCALRVFLRLLLLAICVFLTRSVPVSYPPSSPLYTLPFSLVARSTFSP